MTDTTTQKPKNTSPANMQNEKDKAKEMSDSKMSK